MIVTAETLLPPGMSADTATRFWSHPSVLNHAKESGKFVKIESKGHQSVVNPDTHHTVATDYWYKVYPRVNNGFISMLFSLMPGVKEDSDASGLSIQMAARTHIPDKLVGLRFSEPSRFGSLLHKLQLTVRFTEMEAGCMAVMHGDIELNIPWVVEALSSTVTKCMQQDLEEWTQLVHAVASSSAEQSK